MATLTTKRHEERPATSSAPERSRLVTADIELSVRPRKLPRQERAAATVAAILEAAARILETHGLEAYTTNAVAELAGASIGSLYQYFPNKAALTQALIAREEAVLLLELQGLLANAEASDLLRGVIRVATVHQLRRPALARLLDAAEAQLPQREEEGDLERVLGAVFERCIPSHCTALEPRAAQDLFAIIHGMVDEAGHRGEADPAALGLRVERAVFGYLAAFGVPAV